MAAETTVDRVAGEARQGPHTASPVTRYLERLLERHAGVDTGAVASYIPELARIDPSLFAIALVTLDGAVYDVGDSRTAFTIQSISKPLTYAAVLEEHGEEAVRRRIGVEPTGEAFNSISLAPDTGTPLNAMVNAGAITAAALVGAGAQATPFDRLMDVYGRCAGRPLSLDEATYVSESETGHRNRAIAHLLRSAGVVDGDPERGLDTYFRQCSVRIDCVDLAVIAATLAGGGVNPLTGERVFEERTVRKTLAVMTSCGMYDFAGAWMTTVGLPAKSGVSGGILAVLPGKLGLAVYAPPLDERGNSVRGVLVCQDISRDLDLHLVRPARPRLAAVRSSYDLRAAGSKRVRSERVAELLRSLGSRTQVLELQGDIDFAAAEAVTRAVIDRPDDVDVVVLDLRRVGAVDEAVHGMLEDLLAGLAESGVHTVLSIPERHEGLRAIALSLATGGGVQLFETLDTALEHCEATLLARVGESPGAAAVELREHELLRGLGASEVELIDRCTTTVVFQAGDLVVRRDDPATELFLVLRGELSVEIHDRGGERRRLATISAGMLLGEIAALSRGGRRTADVRADTEVECRVLTADALRRLRATHPDVACTMLANIVTVVARSARRMTEELEAVTA